MSKGPGSYGAGLTRHLQAERVRVVEVDRPNRQRRRRKGKSDPQDAIRPPVPPSRATPSAKPRRGTETSNPCGFCASLGPRLAKARTQALNQMRGLVSTAPEPIRAELRGLNVFHLLERASAYRPGTKRDIVSLTKFTLRMLARRAIALEEEIAEIDAILKPLVKETAPELVATLGIGTDAASALLVAAGDNPERLHNEAAFAHLCGASPSTPAAASRNDTASTAAVIARPTRPSGTSCSPAWSMTHAPPSTSIDGRRKASPRRRRCDASSATSLERCSASYLTRNSGLTAHRSIVQGHSRHRVDLCLQCAT